MATDSDLKLAIVDALDGAKDPKTEKSLLDTQLIEGVEVDDGVVTIKLESPGDRSKNERWALEEVIYGAVEAVDNVKDVTIEVFTKDGTGVSPQSGVAPRSGSGHSHGPAEGHSHGPAAGGAGGVPSQRQVEGVKCIIAVASGKGGVGKSTVACNLALAMQSLGHKVGLLDIDIYGPSLPTLLGIEGRPKVKDRRILPLKAYGLNVMSLGFLLEDDAPAIWRGPIVTSIIRQFLQDVDWRGTDYLILDLPPGTGDAQLTLAQSVPLDGAVVVTTPSDLALIDAARGLQMFNTLNVDVLGIVENMSHFVCDNCDEKHYIFGQGGGAREAKRLDTELLGEIPLDSKVRAGGDAGKPVMAVDPESPTSKAFVELAQTVIRLRPLDGEASEGKKKGLFSFLRS